jgi:hypothetical protein
MVPASRRFCRRHLALRMKGLHRAHRAHEDRRLPRRSEKLHRSVQFTDVDQSSRPDLQMAVRLVVDADGHIVIDAGCQVAEMRRREHVARDCFKLHYIQRLLRARNQAGSRCGSFRHRQHLPAMRRRSKNIPAGRPEQCRTGQGRAERKIPQKFSPAFRYTW